MIIYALLRRKEYVAIFQGFHMELVARLARGGAVAPEGEHIDLEACHQIDELRKLVRVRARNGIHDGDPNACALKAFNGAQRIGERAGFTEIIVRSFEPVE